MVPILQSKVSPARMEEYLVKWPIQKDVDVPLQ